LIPFNIVVECMYSFMYLLFPNMVLWQQWCLWFWYRSW